MVQKASCEGNMPHCQMQDARCKLQKQGAGYKMQMQYINAMQKERRTMLRCCNAKCHVQECKRAQSKVKNLTMLMFGYLYESLGDTIYNH
jgi:hypothetical protein